MFDATLQLLAEVGYRRLSVDAIAKQANASRPTIYRKFGSLDNLIITASLHSYEDVSDTATLTGDLHQDIVNHLAGTVAILHQTSMGEAIRAAVPEMKRNPSFASLANRIGLERRKSLKKLLISAQQSGIVGSQVDVDALIDGLIGAVYHRFLVTQRKLDRPYLKKLFDGLRSGDPAVEDP